MYNLILISIHGFCDCVGCDIEFEKLSYMQLKRAETDVLNMRLHNSSFLTTNPVEEDINQRYDLYL